MGGTTKSYELSDVLLNDKESAVWTNFIKEEKDDDYTLKWTKPNEGYSFKDFGNFLLDCLYDKHKHRKMVEFEEGLKMKLKTLENLIWAVPLTTYKFLPSNTYFNCWRAPNYFIYAFTQLRDCMSKHKDISHSHKLVSACLPKITENLTRCAAYNPKRADWTEAVAE